jgi:formylglycine-generating enzyme required for sulfatase activity
MVNPSHTGEHWPIFDTILCGDMTDRERLGLPDYYQPDRFGDALPALYAHLRHCDQDELIQYCEDPQMPLAERVAAGNLLALLGDSRPNTQQPPMITIDGGTVLIGLDEADVEGVVTRYAQLGLDRAWITKECPRHPVTLPRYRIGKYPVTNQEYAAFLRATQYAELPSSWTFRRYPQERSNHPVYTVSATAADAYARWLTALTGRRFRLPSEAEWEYAAAGPTGREFPWGDDFEADRANTAETGLFCSSPVGVFVDGNSPFGMADMAGNVEEYVADTYAPYPGGQFVSDHLATMQGDYRVARGGSFARFRDLARTRRRHGHNPRSATYAMGFRLAEEI